MPKISIVVAYRNRDLARVSRFLDSVDRQTYRDFELVFVDYGSDQQLADKVAEETNKYSWCKYIYSDTRGMLWNKSRAINSGVRHSSGEYLISTDVDLIYTAGVLEYAMQFAAPDRQLFYRAYMLPETFSDYQRLPEVPNHFKKSEFTAIGMFHMISNDVFQNKLQGLDEFYCIWGHEDTDGYLRGRQAGLESLWLDNAGHAIYHQWHPSQSIKSKEDYPFWWEEVTTYLELNREKVKRNNEDWGSVYQTSDRLTISGQPYTKMHVRAYMNSAQRARLMKQIVHFLKHNPDKVLEIRISKRMWLSKDQISLKGKGVRTLMKLLRKVNLALIKYRMPIQLQYSGPNKLVSTRESMVYFLFNLIVRRNLVKEYYLDEEKKDLVYRLRS